MKLIPLGDRILVEAIEEKEQVRGGIYIPDASRDAPQDGKVMAAGSGCSLGVKRGDRVLLPKYGATVVKLDGKSYHLVREEELLGVLVEDK